MSVVRIVPVVLATLVAGSVVAAPLGAPPLITAAEGGDRIAVSKLLDQGAAVDTRAVDGTTALHWAARADRLDTVLLLLESGADPRAADRYGVTPLYLAAENGSTAVIAALLDAGAEVDGVAPIGETALMTAARTGVVAAVALLLDRGAAVDARDREFEQTALMLAVREAHPEVVALLLERGADVDARTRVGTTPKFVPPCKGTGCGSEGVGINRGGLPDRGRRAAVLGGMTSLLYAARDGRTAEAELLLAAGADLELAEANGMRPLLMARLNDQVAVADLLLAHGADVNADDFWGRTPLFAAVDYRNLDMNNRDEDAPTTNYVDRAPLLAMMTKLIEHGADVNARTREVPPSRRWLYSLGDVSWVDFTGQTPFLRAALSGDVTAMRLLLQHGADANLATQAGTTPLMAASGVNWVVAQTYTESPQSQLQAISLCLEHGADVNAVNSMGLTAVLGAANRGANDIIRLLAQNGARLDVVDKEGRSALRWAEGVFLAAVGAERKPATIALLEELGAPRIAAAR
jgi:ankyrin repeat protein